MHQLSLTCCLAFNTTPSALLTLIQQALTRMFDVKQRGPVWQITQGTTPAIPPTTHHYFRAQYFYSQPSAHFPTLYKGSVSLNCLAQVVNHQGLIHAQPILEFSDSYYERSPIEPLAVATGFFVTQVLREQSLISDDQTSGCWQVSPPYRDVGIANALANGGKDIGGFCWLLQRFGLFPVIDETAVREAIWTRSLFMP